MNHPIRTRVLSDDTLDAVNGGGLKNAIGLAIGDGLLGGGAGAIIGGPVGGVVGGLLGGAGGFVAGLFIDDNAKPRGLVSPLRR